jgi:AraC family transcriptional regulator, exoenzyme S synthesis regulatory protein ExsA
MLNVVEALRSPLASQLLPGIRRFLIGDLTFAAFSCPATDGWEASWAEHDRLVHITSGRKLLKSAAGILELGAGDIVFVKKGAHFVRHDDSDLCVYMYFLPDDFIRTAVREIAADLPVLPPPADPPEIAIRVREDTGVRAFLKAMAVFFETSDAPAPLLLKLKVKELIASIVVSATNPMLSAYLRMVASSDAPSIPAIMEANCCHNLSLEEFAKLCNRSLSTFKRDFRKHYGTSPGRWLLDQRLECSARLLTSTSMNVTEIVFECGFEQPSHFSRAFKAKFGRTPSEYRQTRAAA